MAMLIAWQTINWVRRKTSSRFTRGFLIIAPGLTIKDRLRVLQPNDPDSYFKSRELVPGDMLPDLEQARIVITNYHAFKLRNTIDLSSGGRALLQGRGPELNTTETEGQMIKRVMPELMGMRNIMVIGRALRRQSYELNADNKFDVEYADVLGIPFDFNAKPVVAPPQKPRETVQVKAIRPERDALEIRFPRVSGYRVDLPNENIEAEFTDDHRMVITPQMVGATETRNSGIIGEQIDLNLVHTGNVRHNKIVYTLTDRMIDVEWRKPGENKRIDLFFPMKRIVNRWLKECTEFQGKTYPAQLLYQSLADQACKKISAGIVNAHQGTTQIKAMLDAYNPSGSTRFVNFNTSKADRWQTSVDRCHVNWVVLDSDWEAEFCRIAEKHPSVRAYVKNHGLGFEVPYRYLGEARKYRPDFIVLIDDGRPHFPMAHLICCIWLWRLKATAAKTPARKRAP